MKRVLIVVWVALVLMACDLSEVDSELFDALIKIVDDNPEIMDFLEENQDFSFLEMTISCSGFTIGMSDISGFYNLAQGLTLDPEWRELLNEVPTVPATTEPIEELGVLIRAYGAEGRLLYEGDMRYAFFNYPSVGFFAPWALPPQVGEPIRVGIAPLISEETTVITGSCNPDSWRPDERIGPDMASDMNVYCDHDNLSIYAGDVYFVVSAEQITSVGIPAQHTLLASQGGIAVYRLNDGLFQLMGTPSAEGKQDVLIFDLGSACSVLRWRRGHLDTLTTQTHIYSQDGNWAGYPFDY